MPTLSPLPSRSAADAGPSWLQALLEAFGTPLPDLQAVEVGEQVTAARTALAEAGLPGRREEAWRFTDLSLLPRIAPRPLATASHPLADLPGPAPEAWRLPLGGRPSRQEIHWPEGVEPLHGADLEAHLGQVLAATQEVHHWCSRLNSAITQQVVALRIRGTVAPCLELVAASGEEGGVLPLRLLLLLEEGASLQLLQVHRAAGANLTSMVVEARLGRNATLQHALVAEGSASGALLATTAVEQAPGSHYAHSSVVSGWGLVRQEPVILQSEGQAHTLLRGLQWVEGKQIADTHSRVHFGGPQGRLDQLHKVVAQEEGRSVFNGCIQVPRRAQGTDASQLSRNLLLSDRARIDTKPELQIVADDVRCTHGATISRLQQDELFYLQSRGIAAAQGARLLLRGFCEEVLAELPEAAQVWNPLAPNLAEGR